MIDKGKKNRQLSKRQKELMARFRIAYERLSFHQRQILKKKFCTTHVLTPGTFYNKMSGFSAISETEVEWIEAYNPYAEAAAVQV
jgi:hypothetical protein